MTPARTSPDRPLAGIRVLEFGGYISGPYATSFLCALGADVVKVEHPRHGDPFRHALAQDHAWFRQYNSGKRSIAVDLKRPEGIELVEALIPSTDVVLENLRPGKMEALGLGAAELSAIRPDLVHASLTGFGTSGPMAQRPAYDMVGQAFGGLVATLSDAGNARLSGTCLADLVSGLSTAAGVLAALAGRSSTAANPGDGSVAAGTRVETSINEAVSTLTADAITQFFDSGQSPTRQSRHPQAQNFCLQTASDDFIVIHLSSSQKFWASLVATIDRPDLLSDPRFTTYDDRVAHYFDLEPMLESEFVGRPSTEWQQLLTEHGVPFAPVNTVADYHAQPQVRELEIFEPLHDGLVLVRPPWRFNSRRPTRSQHTPTVGEHTVEIASEVCSPARIEELLEAGVLRAG